LKKAEGGLIVSRKQRAPACLKGASDLRRGAACKKKMIEEIRLRNFSPRTEQSYVSAMVGLAKYYRQSPDQLSQEQIRAYLLHLKERGLSPSSRNVAISGMKFFSHQCLGWN
jgi:integrase/recombinase XerD